MLDNEWSGAIGQDATVKFVVSKTTATMDGVDLSAQFIVDNNLTDIMSESFSLCEALAVPSQIQFDGSISEQAAAQGITFVAATGDAGANGCDDANSETLATGPVSAGIPATSPFVTAIGGTQFNGNGDDALYWSPTTNADGSSALKYIPEDVWNESCVASTCLKGVAADGSEDESPNISAGGGGSSANFAKPAYQSTLAGSHRGIPDVSFSASGHVCATVSGGKCTTVHTFGYILCQQSAGSTCASNTPLLLIISGTSAPTPSFAGVMSLVDQKTNSRQGLANITLYHLASQDTAAQCNASTVEPGTPPANTCNFNDVTIGNNSVPISSTGTLSAGFSATVGDDLASGLGSANVANIANNWASFVRTSTSTMLTLNPNSVAQGTSVTLSGSVTSGGGMPTGDVSFIAASSSVPGLGFTTLSGGNFSAATTTLPTGSYTIVAHYGGDINFAPSDSTPQNITVTGGGGGGSFAVSANPTSMTVAAGNSPSTMVTATGSGGFAGTVNLTEVVAGPNGAVEPPTCAFSPMSSIALTSSTTSGSVTMTCTTQMKSHVLFGPLRGPNRPVWLGVSAALALLCIFALSLPMQKRRWATAFAFVVLAAATAVAGCGGGGGGGGGNHNPGTTAGTYTVTVTGAVNGGASHTTTFTIMVQ